ncbi:holo-[acyl-carrier-protein] synthase [Batrachochytrium salamandrivorans]|nr:holo-[acyl-carrier-protein] synthase [Batrachochytrium salamandrivorans]
MPGDFFVLFGGQGYSYLPEIAACQSGQARKLLELAQIALCEEEAIALQTVHLGRFPFTSRWLVDPAQPAPPAAHLSASPCSFPLIFLAQMLNYLDALERLGETHDEFVGKISGGSGHSQGVVSAFVISISPTHESLMMNAIQYLRCMFWVGVRVHMHHSLQMDDGGKVMQSPMLAVSGLTEPQLAMQIQRALVELKTLNELTIKAGGKGSKLALEESTETLPPLHISLVNAHKACIVSGKPKALLALRENLAKLSAQPNSQGRIPFSNRKPEITTTFLQVSAPFHCALNAPWMDSVNQDWERVLGDEKQVVLAFPVLSTHDAKPILASPSVLIAMMLVESLHFPTLAAEVPKLATRVFEFGPSSGAAKLFLREQEGSGVLVVTSRSIDPRQAIGNPHSTTMAALLLTLPNFIANGKPTQGPNWGQEFAPKLVFSSSYGKLVVDTKFTRLVKRPPVMMGGMTPTTGFYGIDLVSACTKAGYHGEVAGGGMPLPEHFKLKIEELVEKNPAGAGVAINMLYLNAYLWGFQFPLFVEMANAGFPVESVTIAAGVPTGEKAEEILEKLASVGTKYLSLKPGTAQAILDCLSIASFAKTQGIQLVLQWTGGRGGGHHSFEDFHEPLLETYARIRAESNVVLVVGSGFGNAEQSFPYLSGEWSTKLGKPAMPCDGILMGSRCMVALEASTSSKVKEMIVNTVGVDHELEWEKSYQTDAGGVVTVTSELGEPIHKIHNRGMKCWRDFDRKYFSLERGAKRLAAVLQDKQEIIHRLNADFQKVFFGTRMATKVPCDLEEMSYMDVLLRMTELMYVENGESPNFPTNRWIDVTYQTRTFLFLVRTERRFRRHGRALADNVAKLREFPTQFMNEFGQVYPEAHTTLLADDDVSYFVDLCKDLRNGKPVNFVPRIDGDLDFWFKKDSLWCSEDLDAIPGRDAQRVCVLQGPVAVRHSDKVNEPIADILNAVHGGWAKILEQTIPQTEIPTVESFATLNVDNVLEIQFPFLTNLPHHAWQRIVLDSNAKVCHGKRLRENVLPKLFRVALQEQLTITVTEQALICEKVELERLDQTRLRLRVRNDGPFSSSEFVEIYFDFYPFFAHAPLVQVDLNTKSVYEQVWLAPLDRGIEFSAHEVHHAEFVLTPEQVLKFNQAIQRLDVNTDAPLLSPSLDCAIMCGWRPLIKTLFAKEITGDLLRLVHLSHSYRLLDETNFAARQLQQQQRAGAMTIQSNVRIVSVEILRGSGKKIVCQGVLQRAGGQDWVEITSAFLIRGEFDDFQNQFSRLPAQGEQEIVVMLESEADCAVLRSKPWFKPLGTVTAPLELVFVLDDLYEQSESEFAFSKVKVQGRVFENGDRVHVFGTVQFDSNEGQLLGENPVLTYLRRNKQSGEKGKMLENGGVTLLGEPLVFNIPDDPKRFEYGHASGDLNPIHMSSFFACLAELPSPIVHGMWTCALARQVVERGACDDGDANLLYKFDVEFVGMVQFGAGELVAQLMFVGVVAGRKVIKVEMRILNTNQVVLRGRAEVEQSKSAFLFTGQGSAFVGMGMDRYDEVNTVRNVWDQADSHLRSKYGFSILDIVRHNPKELTVHFGGPAGRVLRENYRAIRVSKNGETVQLLPQILQDTKSFTFKAPEGLLFATQFAQPALVVVQKAAFQELVDSGLVPVDSAFAGHSLGEYAGLASFADVLSVQDLVETVFLRGMVMQNAVPRNAKGSSEFGMVAVNPSRVKFPPKFSSQGLLQVVDKISTETGLLLQVVNFNVRDAQYVVAGHLVALDCLEYCLSQTKEYTIEAALTRSRERFAQALEADVAFALERGSATIPLPGIDVPFHSRQLLSGVPAFRELLEPRLTIGRVSRMLHQLIGKYIPNVTAKFFSLDVAYVELSAKAMESKRLYDLAARMRSAGDMPEAAEIARVLLRIVEMGPAPTLVGMAQKMFEISIYSKDAPREILWWGRDMNTVVYAGLEDKGPSLDAVWADYQQKLASASEESEEEEQAPEVVAVASKPAPAVAPAAKLAPAPVAAVSSSSDLAVSAKHVLRVLLASKFKRSFADMKDEATIKSLSQGKSAVQNEIVGDLAAEFNLDAGGAGNVAETPLQELAGKIQASGYSKLGKVSTVLISRTLAGKLPGNFAASAARAHLQSARGLGANVLESVLLHGCAVAPPATRLPGPSEAKKWLEDAADLFARDMGVSFQASGGGGSGASSQACVEDEEDAPGGPVSIPDVAPTAKHSLQVLLAIKMKLAVRDIKDDSTVKSLSQGKSAVQNEVVGDLSGEFPEGAGLQGIAEMPIAELAGKLGASGYSKLGKITSQLISKTMAAKLPGSFPASSAREYLQSKRGLGPMVTESVLLHAAAGAPAGRLASADEAKAWMDASCDSFAAVSGLNLTASAGGGGGRRARRASTAVSSEALTQHEKRLAALLRAQVDAFESYLGAPESAANNGEATATAEDLLLLDACKQELGDKFIDGIRGKHDALKVREYDSYWNWVIQDALELHLHVLDTLKRMRRGEAPAPTTGANGHFEAMSKWIQAVAQGSTDYEPPQAWFRNFLCNRATKELLVAVEYFANDMQAKGQVEYAQIITLLAEQVEAWVNHPPVLVVRATHNKPQTTVTAQGKIQFSEIERSGVADCVEYIEELSCGSVYSRDVAVAFDMSQVPHPSYSVVLSNVDGSLLASGEEDFAAAFPASTAAVLLPKSPRRVLPSGPILDTMRGTVIRQGSALAIPFGGVTPLIHLKSCSEQDRTVRVYDELKTAQYLSCLHDLASQGVSFDGQVCLVTGGGIGSIAIEVVKMLLEGGATVISAINYAKSEESIQATLSHYRRIYEEHGSKNSRLITEPCNAGSALDVNTIVDHIYNVLKLDVDFIVPFAAIPERGGRDISNLDSESELSHRAMLTNVIRLCGKVREVKQQRSISTRPAMVLLPMSPNHGVFGNDGLYAESKLGIEALMDKWRSEGWQDYLSLAGCVIGWTRSALMFQNNIVASGVEVLGCRTFSTTEMAVNLVGLMHPRMVSMACDEPLWADLTGGWQKVQDLDQAVKRIRQSLQDEASTAQALFRDAQPLSSSRAAAVAGSSTLGQDQAVIKRADVPAATVPLSNPKSEFPSLPSSQTLKEMGLEGAVDLRKVVCIVGFGEVGPWGNSRTRWEMEAFGEFSLEGCVELAWLVGLIQHIDGPLPNNPRVRHIGWIDTTTKEPVFDHEVKRRYEETILKHSGIRIVEPELFEGYNPRVEKRVWTKVGVDRDLPAVEVSSEEMALEIQRACGGRDKCEIIQEGTSFKIKVKSGSVLAIPRAFQFNRFIAGQIPTGWSAERLGVPSEICKSVDPVTLYALISTMEAFVSAGVCDPYELYQYVHVAEVGNTSGGGMGGMRSLKRMFTDRALDDPEVPSDTLAESFINTMPAWVNMLLLSSSGPIKTPVGACATAAESLDIGCETLLSGKARVVVCGGYDDFGEVGAFEFAAMGATQDNAKDEQKGRRANEASRPMTSTRSGFVEAHGSGMQVLMDAELAIEMGCPIYSVVALTNTATDREGRSIPAPGRGILTTAREEVRFNASTGARKRNRCLDVQYRRKQIAKELAVVQAWEEDALLEAMGGEGDGNMEEDGDEQELISRLAHKKRAAVFETWGQGFYRNLTADVGPLTGALAVFGLGVDDIGAVSCHGTSTTLNDKNESSVINLQLEHLGRAPGNICLVVAQKWLTAHPKGAAAAWMINGACQILNTGLVPGNRNLDNCALELQKFPLLFYPNRSVQLPGVEAVLLKSFGFGQAGAEVLLVNPNRVLACLSEEQFVKYSHKRGERERRTFRFSQGVLSDKHRLFQAKTRAPYLPDQEASVYLNPNARASFDSTAKTWVFKRSLGQDAILNLKSGKEGPVVVAKPPSPAVVPKTASVSAETRLKVTLQEQAEGLTSASSNAGGGIGVDVEPIATFDNLADKQDFIQRNFTEGEIAHCTSAASPSASFAGRWAAKEAVVKAISSASPEARSLWTGAHAPLIGIEIVHSLSGAPAVVLHGHAAQVASALGITEIKVSISHAGEVAVAQAMTTSN